MATRSKNPVEAVLEQDAPRQAETAGGAVARIARAYNPSGDRLLGFLLNMSYQDMSIVTCDPWKHKCGGVPQNSFVIIKMNPRSLAPFADAQANRLILARITESIPTPVASDIQAMVFQVHKIQAIVDPITNKELQWHALKASVLGTYYDDEDTGEVGFGNDIDSFMAPHCYEVYVPEDRDLATLLNSFVCAERALPIGRLRYTETPTVGRRIDVPILVDIDDFIGKPEDGRRTGLFGKTRFGKSNTIKVIGDNVLRSGRRIGQIFFDPSGEYTYYNQQDGTSLYVLHHAQCVRYSLDPKLPPEEAAMGLTAPGELRINFFSAVPVGHNLFASLFASHFPNRPNYLQPILNWQPPELSACPAYARAPAAFNHFWRSMAMWYGLLALAEYDIPTGRVCPVTFRRHVKEALLADRAVRAVIRTATNAAGATVMADQQPIAVLPLIYRKVAVLYEQHKDDDDWFGSNSDGTPYFNGVEQAMLRILADDGTISGKTYLVPFRRYHSVRGGDTFTEIADHVEAGRTVFVDFAKAADDLRANLSERICWEILRRQMDHFHNNTMSDKWIMFYFEEAHTLFRADDRDLTSIYNKLAKEGAKFQISMVYATQSMTTMSPDLLKMTENVIIGHLSDDREVREVTRRYEFRDVAEDVQRIRSRGFVRMITSSHRFALPVQIRKFERPAPAEARQGRPAAGAPAPRLVPAASPVAARPRTSRPAANTPGNTLDRVAGPPRRPANR